MSEAVNPQSKILIIVESPTKSSTISSILKKAGYTKAVVKASVGHIMELKNGGPAYNTGIYPDKDFKMNLAVSEDKRKVVDEIKQQVKAADIVYLMTDGDREGEVIAWSLTKFCDIKKYHRVTTHEITPKAVIKALQNPRALDMNLVNAGLVRMMIDKFIGFGFTPVAKKYLGVKSVGRCQSVGLKLVADRENEINNFIPERYFDLYLNFDKNEVYFKAKYLGHDGEQIEHFKMQSEAEQVMKECEGQDYFIKDIIKRDKHENPKPPFKTSTFQQEASTRLGLSLKDAMSCAQKLFEGISVNGEHVGLITYHRTDSTDFAPEFIPEIKNYVETTYGKSAYVGARSGKKGELDQDGHEALRVVNPSLTPEKLASYISNNLLIKVYKLIWQRTVATVMQSATIAETAYIINNGKHEFSLVSNVLTDPGFKAVYTYEDDKEEIIKESFDIGEKLVNTSLDLQKKLTQPKPRYSEASLNKELERLGVGRPSTYATIVETVISPTRGYAAVDDKKIVPTDRGMQLAAYCDRAFSNIINIDYTSNMESKLDKIASGSLDWLAYMQVFKEELDSTIAANKETGLESQEADKVCPECGAPMVMRRSRFGKLFYGCSKYPKCRGIISAE